MRSLAPPVWHEGMHLAQHHFQAQSRYFEELTAFVATELLFRPYGLVSCEFDLEALKNDVVSLRHARGIMPDGLVFDFPEDAVPEPIDVRSLFSPTEDSHKVLLGIPPLRAGQANVGGELENGGADMLRFRSRTLAIPDEVLGTDQRPVAFAEKNFRLLLDSADSSGLVTLPLARVRRDGSGHFTFDRDYIPPSLQIGASVRLVSLLGRLIDALGEKSDTLAVGRAEAPGDLVNYWLGNTLNSALGPLTHLHRHRRGHPERLYVEMARLAGALCTFSMDAHPRDIPAYDHDSPDECFGALERRIQTLLNVVAPTSNVRIPLQTAGESFFTGVVNDRRCFGPSEWFLGVRSAEGPAEITARVPRLMKVCSSKFIERLVREAFPGLTLEHTISPPGEISPRVGMQYFTIPKTGPCWTSIVETGEIGIYAPAAIPDVELEVVVAIDSRATT